MKQADLLKSCQKHLHTFCVEIGERPVGNPGNRRAADYLAKAFGRLGWQVERQSFLATHWKPGIAELRRAADKFQVFSSPYSLGCSVEGELAAVSSLEELETADLDGKIVLLYGAIAANQLAPKNFVFYNPESDRKIIALLEAGTPKALVCATGRNPSLAGGIYPFPLFEDGDFDIPSVYMTEEEGEKLAGLAGERFSLRSDCLRIPGEGCNVLARRGDDRGGRVVVSAHLDAKLGTPGAIDNATGITLLLLLADLLKTWQGAWGIELCALNGEDYYAASGQMTYLARNEGRFQDILLNINIDGLGYHTGGSAVSFYELPAALEASLRETITPLDAVEVGEPWVQGDHSMFVQMGVPAIALTSQWFSDHIDSQEITHTPKDNLSIVEPVRVVQAAEAVCRILQQLDNSSWNTIKSE